MNAAEEFVFRVCGHSFLSLWSYANPQGKQPGKELCDVLVVCEPDVVIFGVKDITLTDTGDIAVDWERWRRHAIDESCRQIYGAERWINSAAHVIRKDGSESLAFPDKNKRRIHRIAVALGGEDKVPFHMGDLGRGFVHVFDKASFETVLEELDTISDFVHYLAAKENLIRSGTQLVIASEEDLLALYLQRGREFPKGATLMVIDDTLWEGLQSKREYKQKKLADRDSYAWDNLIEMLSEDVLAGNLEFGTKLSQAEIAIRSMDRENRFSRRNLGKSFTEFFQHASQNKVHSRIVASPLTEVLYVFLAAPHDTDRQYRMSELGNRCFVARGLYQQFEIVIGIATERYQFGKGYSLDLFYLSKESWTDQDQTQLESLQRELGYFSDPEKQTIHQIHEDEYPAG